jgi:AcrR family transcriptional regulator
MVQSDVPVGRRQRQRAEREAAYLRTALQIATDEGLHALTMQRLAAEVDCAVGTVYTYFPSKSALIAEVQRQAIDRLSDAWDALTPGVAKALKRAKPDVAALAQIIAAGRFWIDAITAYPQEARLLQLLFSEAGTLEVDDAARVAPAALRHLEPARAAFAAAAAAGALDPGDPMDRTASYVAAINGVVQLGGLARFEFAPFDGARLAGDLIDTLLRGWGAKPTAVVAAWRANRSPLP